jgi:hypothetical protein
MKYYIAFLVVEEKNANNDNFFYFVKHYVSNSRLLLDEKNQQ